MKEDEVARQNKIRQENIALEEQRRKEDRTWAEKDLTDKFEQQRKIREMSDKAKYGTGRLPNMGKTEQKSFRKDWDTADRIRDAYNAAKANEGAFGVTSDTEAFMPDWFANIGTQGIKKIQEKYRDNPQMQARARVLGEMYQMINELAGANLSQHEEARLSGSHVNPNDSFATVMAKMEVVKDIADQKMRGYNRVYNTDVYGDEYTKRFVDPYKVLPGFEGGGEEQPGQGEAVDYSAMSDADLLKLSDEQAAGLPDEAYKRFEALMLSEGGS
jgi:hypothetical protein